MKKIGLVLLTLSASLSVYASDNWNSCISSDGNFKIESGELVVGNSSDKTSYTLGKVIRTKNVRSREETCVLVDSKRQVVSLSETTSYVVYEIITGKNTFNLDFLCADGGSGIPAADSCSEATAKLAERYY